MKKIRYFLFFLLVFLTLNSNVLADVDVCKYVILGSNNKTYNLNISYTNENKFKITWTGPGLLGDGEHTNIGTEGSSLLKDGQFYPSLDSLIERGTCPEHAYIDEGGGLASEFCLDSDGSTCKSHNNIGTDFSKNHTNKLIYNMNEKIQTDGNLASSQIKTMCGTSVDQITNSFYNNFQVNGTIPAFISANSTYQNAISSLNDATNDCIKQADEKEQSGEWSKDQANQIRDNAQNNKDTITSLKEKGESNKGANDTPGSNVTGCGLISGDFLKFLQWAFDVIKVVGPIMALLLGMIDFIKATASGEDDAKKKAIKDVKNRLIAAFLLFLIPAILQFALNLANGLIPGLDNNNVTCGIK